MIKKILAIFVLCLTNLVHAQDPGNIDTTFGNNGFVGTNIGLQDYQIMKQAIQPDGKIVMVGQYRDISYYGSFVIRTNADGTLDTSFNGTGKIRINLERFNIVKIQTDGKIVVGGANQCVMRFTTAGAVDTSFNSLGYVYNPDTDAAIIDLIIQPDGKILALTNIDDYNNEVHDFKMLRYNFDGTVDTTFDGDGELTTDLGFIEDAKAMMLQSDGKIIVNGIQSTATSTYKYFFARYNSNGSVDTGFNGTGFQVLSFANSTYTDSFGIALQPNGKILTGGYTTQGMQGTFTYLTRINSNGTLDNTFGTAGVYKSDLILNTGYNFFSNNCIKLKSDGKIIVANNRYFNNSEDIIIRRFNSNGTPDTNFGTAGILEYSFFTDNDQISDFDLVGNKILMSGYTQENFFTGRLIIASFNENGTLDTSFSDDGKAYLFMTDGGSDTAHTIVKQADGKMLVGGAAYLNGFDRYAITKYNADGSLDMTFASGTGKFVGSLQGNVAALAIDSNGKIIVVGGHGISNSGILRLNSDGSLDTTFGVNGLADLSGQNYFGAHLNAVAIQPNGKILIGGSLIDWATGNASNYSNFTLFRLNANGTFDSTFGTNGISLINIEGTPEDIKAIHILDNGKILAAGDLSNGETTDVAVLRFNSNGTLDNSFNGNGMSTYDSGESDYCSDMAVQADGKIIISLSEAGTFKTLRIMPDGSTDTTYGENGVSSIMIQDFSSISALKLQADQKILAVGYSYNETAGGVNFAIARLNANGAADNSFGDDGNTYLPMTNRHLYADACVITGDTVITAGTIYSLNYETSDFLLAKFHLSTGMGVDPFTSEKVAFYPNPVVEKAIFTPDVVAAELFNIQGKLMSALLVNNEMNLSKIASGTYIIRMNLGNGKTISQKLIKK